MVNEMTYVGPNTLFPSKAIYSLELHGISDAVVDFFLMLGGSVEVKT